MCRNEARSSAIQLTPAVNIRASRLCALYHLSHHINLTNKEEKKKNKTLTLMQTLSILLCSSYSGKSYEHPPFPGHAAELPFVFHTLEDYVCTQEELQLADSASMFWGNFVKYGNPNGQSAEQGEGYCAEEECKVCNVALAQNLLISCLSLLLRLTDVYVPDSISCQCNYSY